MDRVLRAYADALLDAAASACGHSAAPCDDALCRVAALHDALARGAYVELAAQLAPDVEVECFGVRLPGFARFARGVDAAVALYRANEAGMRWTALSLESAIPLGDTLVVLRRERGAWAGAPHAADVVGHYGLRDTRIARVRVRAFPPRGAGSCPRPGARPGA